jgi:hypothetical protein
MQNPVLEKNRRNVGRKHTQQQIYGL